LGVGLTVAGLLFAAAPAAAQAVDSAGAEDYAAPATEERGGFMIGLGYGFGYGQIGGYPNKLTEIGQSEFRQDVGGLGVTSTIWLGGALRDWLTFGVGLFSTAAPGDKIGSVGGIGARVEGFPLYALGGIGHDLAIYGEFGAGGGGIVHKDDQKRLLADGGSMSLVSFGAFWEALKFWRIVLGPSVQYTHAFSESLNGNAVTVGIRTAFYWTRPRGPAAEKPQTAEIERSQPGAAALTTRW
jgi:hypothetical protein